MNVFLSLSKWSISVSILCVSKENVYSTVVTGSVLYMRVCSFFFKSDIFFLTFQTASSVRYCALWCSIWSAVRSAHSFFQQLLIRCLFAPICSFSSGKDPACFCLCENIWLWGHCARGTGGLSAGLTLSYIGLRGLPTPGPFSLTPLVRSASWEFGISLSIPLPLPSPCAIHTVVSSTVSLFKRLHQFYFVHIFSFWHMPNCLC